VTHADELIADTAPSSTFGEMHDENVIFGVIQDGTVIPPPARERSVLNLAELPDIS
jgi:hypothetical protein